MLDLGSGLGQTLIVLVNELKRINASSEFDTSERGINSEYDDASASDHEGESKDENMIHWMTGTSIIGTDYDTATLDNMRGNFKINGIEVDESTKTDGATTDNDNNGNTDNNQPSVSVQVRQLDWANHTPDTIEACASDIILSCDTIYDPDYHEALAKTLRVLLETAEKRKGQSEPFGLFAQHARTSETYIRYVETFLRNGLLMEEYSVDDLPQHFNYSRELIKLHRITLLPPGFKAISIPTVRRQTGALCL